MTLNTSDINKSKWILPEIIDNTILSNSLSLPKWLLVLLARRGITKDEEIIRFINPVKPPKPVDHFYELGKAVERLSLARINNEKIAICGDYDADGITSTALLVDVFKNLNIPSIPFIPNRESDGYGLNTNIVDRIYSQNIKLIVTVDNGVSAIEAIQKASKLNIDIIITDHHLIPKSLPEVHALIHPQNTPNNSPYRYLAGVGLAYILAKT